MEERKSRVVWSGNTTGKGNADGETEKILKDILNEFGIALEDEANISKLDLFRLPIFRKFENVGVVTANKIIYVISPPSAGGFPVSIWLDFRQASEKLTEDDVRIWNELTRDDSILDNILKWIYQELGWTRVWTLELGSELLELQPHERAEVLPKVAREKVEKEKEEMEREAGLVTFNPIFKGRGFSIQNALCFVLMPFAEPFIRLYKDHIKPILEKSGLSVMIAKDFFTSTPVIDDIWRSINEACLIVADITGENPNVFYELGLAHTIGKKSIILNQNKDDAPFDISHVRYFTYTDNEEGWKELEKNLEEAVRATIH